jgi:hypothetical protein
MPAAIGSDLAFLKGQHGFGPVQLLQPDAFVAVQGGGLSPRECPPAGQVWFQLPGGLSAMDSDPGRSLSEVPR